MRAVLEAEAGDMLMDLRASLRPRTLLLAMFSLFVQTLGVNSRDHKRGTAFFDIRKASTSVRFMRLLPTI